MSTSTAIIALAMIPLLIELTLFFAIRWHYINITDQITIFASRMVPISAALALAVFAFCLIRWPNV